MQFRTRAIHVGNEPDPQTGAVVRPIYVAATNRSNPRARNTHAGHSPHP